jgi:antitoxin HicB
MCIEWSEQDQAYLVLLPEFTYVVQPVTHGRTYKEAVRNGREVLKMLVDSAAKDGETLPTPSVHVPA